MTCILVSGFFVQQLSLQHLNGDVRRNNNALKELNDCIGGLLHLGLNIITFRTLLHLEPNVIRFRTLFHLEQLLDLGLQQGPPLHVNRPSITVTVVEIYKSNRAKHRMYTRGSCTSEYFLATTTYFEYFMCARILFSSHSLIYNNIHSYM